jgi:GNAT superfamily N-acetyltransferase
VFRNVQDLLNTTPTNVCKSLKMKFGIISYNDLAEIRKLQPEGWTDIVPEFENYIKRDFCFPIKASFDNRIAGVGSLIVFGSTAWLAHIIVDHGYRNRGLGFQITEKLVKEGHNKSVKTCLLIATELGLPVYKKLGFRIVTEYQFFKRVNPWRGFQWSSHISPYENNLKSRIYEIDEKISGENRKSLLGDYLENTLVYIKNNALTGFYMPDLGEGPILASTKEAGTELMKIKYSKADKAVLPVQNHTGTEFLIQNGFALSATRGTRMILGNEIHWKPEQIFSRSGGNYG